MTTPARRLHQRRAAAKAAGAAQPSQPQAGEQYELHAAALYEARRTLKGIKSLEAKVARKRELLPEFDAYAEGVLNGGTGAQDDVLMTVMLWRFDIGDLEGGLAIAEYALRHGLATPDRYERDTATLVAEQVAEEALAQLEQEETDVESLAELLARTVELTGDADMHDQVRAKLHKAYGYTLRDAGETEDALEHLKRALKLNERAGVKKDIEKLERELKQNSG